MKSFGTALCFLSGLVLMPGVNAAQSSERLRDPTQPPTAATSGAIVPEAKVALALQSILVSGLRRQALINDRLLQVGDVFQGLEVLEIGAGRVVLRDGQEQLTLSLAQAPIRRNPTTGDSGREARSASRREQ